MKKVLGLILGLIPVSAFAECVPVPDCASIGYTESTCDGDSLKCPFDVTKLLCIPCDSSFRFSCVGENITSAVGDACNGKYVTCNCIEGTIFVNGECVCDNSCNTIGNILYSDMSCSSCLLSEKTAIGVISYTKNNKKYALSLNNLGGYCAYGGASTYATAEEAVLDFNGMQNTIDNVNSGGAMAQKTCYTYSTEGTSAGDWYLPALGEVMVSLVTNADKVNAGISRAGGDAANKNSWNSTLFNDGTNKGHWLIGSDDLPYYYLYGSTWIKYKCMISF